MPPGAIRLAVVPDTVGFSVSRQREEGHGWNAKSSSAKSNNDWQRRTSQPMKGPHTLCTGIQRQRESLHDGRVRTNRMGSCGRGVSGRPTPRPGLAAIPVAGSHAARLLDPKPARRSDAIVDRRACVGRAFTAPAVRRACRSEHGGIVKDRPTHLRRRPVGYCGNANATIASPTGFGGKWALSGTFPPNALAMNSLPLAT